MVRSRASAGQLSGMGLEAISVDLDKFDPLQFPSVSEADLYYFAPPPPVGETDSRVAGLIEYFERSGHPRRVVYISTTGVYGDCSGDWVDESRPVKPSAARSKRRMAAERAWRRWRLSTGRALAILRVSGIYGPGRLPLKRLRDGAPLLCAEEAPFSNRIHIDDLVKVCVAAMASEQDDALYNVSDGHPSTMVDYFNRIADLAGLTRPPLVNREEAEKVLSAGMLSYMNESRRLDNSKMLQELEISLDYPDLETGLKACFNADGINSSSKSAT